MKTLTGELRKVTHSKIIKNKYDSELRAEMQGSQIFVISSNGKIGPFAEVYHQTVEEYSDKLCQYITNTYVYCRDGEMLYAYRADMYGLQQADQEDLTPVFRKVLHRREEKPAIPTFENCVFLGEVFVYKIKDIPNKVMAHKDGLTRMQIPNEKRYIYRDAENRIFVVNPNKPIKAVSEYPKHDSLDEFLIYLNSKNIDYSRFFPAWNPNLSRFVRYFKSKGFSDAELYKLIQKLKDMVGIEEFRNLQEMITISSENKTIFVPEELIEKFQNPEVLSTEFIQDLVDKNGIDATFTQFNVSNTLARPVSTLLEDLIQTLPSSVVTTHYVISYKGKSFSIQKTKKQQKVAPRDMYYQWKNITAFKTDRHEDYRRIYNIQASRWTQYCDASNRQNNVRPVIRHLATEYNILTNGGKDEIPEFNHGLTSRYGTYSKTPNINEDEKKYLNENNIPVDVRKSVIRFVRRYKTFVEAFHRPPNNSAEDYEEKAMYRDYKKFSRAKNLSESEIAYLLREELQFFSIRYEKQKTIPSTPSNETIDSSDGGNDCGTDQN